MNKQFFFLSPVEVVKVTPQNLDEVAEWCGGVVQETESRRVKGRMDKYVLVPTPRNAAISWAFPGMFVTKRLVTNQKNELKVTWAVYRRDYFEPNYFTTPEAATKATWDREAAEAKDLKDNPTTMMQAMARAAENVKVHMRAETEAAVDTAMNARMGLSDKQIVEKINEAFPDAEEVPSPAHQRAAIREAVVEEQVDLPTGFTVIDPAPVDPAVLEGKTEAEIEAELNGPRYLSPIELSSMSEGERTDAVNEGRALIEDVERVEQIMAGNVEANKVPVENLRGL